jgi:hypothetical protein
MRGSLARHGREGDTSKRRIIAAIAALLLFGSVFAVTQVATATERSNQNEEQEESSGNNNQNNRNEEEDEEENEEEDQDENDEADEEEGEELEVLADSCEESQLREHDGFQKGNRCVVTEFGEVGRADSNASLLITEAPNQVEVNEDFTISVSTRNLVRDRFLAAADGGYFKETSLLDDEGLTRGHFHTACRLLDDDDEAQEPQGVPEFFVATEDGGGGADPDEVDVQVAGLPEEGVAQCAVWAGDGSHRIPMMERANQTPALDVVRVVVEGD